MATKRDCCSDWPTETLILMPMAMHLGLPIDCRTARRWLMDWMKDLPKPRPKDYWTDWHSAMLIKTLKSKPKAIRSLTGSLMGWRINWPKAIPKHLDLLTARLMDCRTEMPKPRHLD